MNDLAVVTFLAGTAWAMTSDGTRRVLKTGDHLNADEVLVLGEGARVDLDFGANQVISFVGAQAVSVDAMAERQAEAGQESQNTPPRRDDAEPTDDQSQPADFALRELSSSRVIIPEGHHFVELVRIAEIIEADGMTPLTVAAISEQIFPLTMGYPQEDPEPEEDRDSEGGDESYTNRAPEVTAETLLSQTNFDSDNINITLPLEQLFSDPETDLLTYTVSGLPQGLSFNPEDGTVTGTIDHSASQYGTENDGVYTVTLTAKDPFGGEATRTFTWTVSNPPPVALDNLNFGTTSDSSITGNVISDPESQSGGGVDSDPDGDPLGITYFSIDNTNYQAGDEAQIPNVGTLQINADGSYQFIPVTNWSGTVPVVNYTLSDGEGGTDTAQLRIFVTDTPLIASAGARVLEAGLADHDASNQTTGNIDFVVEAGLDHVVVGGRTLNLADLENLGSSPVTITVGDGEIQLTRFAASSSQGGVPTSGTIEYTYTLKQAQNTPGASDSQLSIPLTVHDVNNTTSPLTSLQVTVVDDVPSTQDNSAIDVIEGGNNIYGSLLSNDRVGADTARVSQISYINESGNLTIANVPENAATPLVVNTEFGGVLSVDSNGSWQYTSPADSTTTYSANNTTSSSGSDLYKADFDYVIVDSDGDNSNWSTQPINVLDTAPSIASPENATLDEQYLPRGSAPDNSELTQIGSLAVTKQADAIDVAFDTSSAANAIATLEALNLTAGGELLTYQLSDNNHTITASNTAGTVFSIVLSDTDSSAASYSVVLSQPLDHGRSSSIVMPIHYRVTDADGDSDQATFTVTILDDASLAEKEISVDEDDEITITTNADATPDNTHTSSPTHGTVVIESDGTITYKPDANYSGKDSFTYTTTTDNGSIETTVTVTVNPLADAPNLGTAAPVATYEDTAVALNLSVPVITDATDQNGSAANTDNPERIGAITLSGIPNGADLLDASDNVIWSSTGNSVTIVISDDSDLHVTGTTGDLTLTSAQFEALKVRPPANSHANFTVTESATSFEVDDAGNALSGVDGATSTRAVAVSVAAVTDDAALTYNTAITSGDTTVASETYSVAYSNSDTTASVTLQEDSGFNLTELLAASFDDLDGSEVRSVTIANNSSEAILVGGSTLAAGASRVIAMPALSTSTTLSAINIAPQGNFSGDITGIEITLNAQDMDADGYTNPSNSTVVTGSSSSPATGVAEADLTNNSLNLNLYVTPRAGDVSASGVTIPEDTEALFLQNLAVTDTGSGNEVITQVVFTLPTGWTLTTPPSGTAVNSFTENSGTYTLTFNSSATEAEREAVLDTIGVTPPANDSDNQTIAVSVTTVDSSTVNGGPSTDTQTQVLNVPVTVTPVAETLPSGNLTTFTAEGTDPDNDNKPRHIYSTIGQEDAWFNLGVEDTFDLGNGWSNADADGSENTYALFTPILQASDGSATNPNGSQFQYVLDGTTHTLTYGGSPIAVPIEALSSLQFKGPTDFSGQFTIQVGVRTVDTDPDGSNTFEDLNVGTLENIILAPVADAVTAAVSAHVTGTEDNPIPMSIVPKSSDPSETYNVTISAIPDGATITYNGVVYTRNSGTNTVDYDGTGGSSSQTTLSSVTDGQPAGTWSLDITNFNPSFGSQMQVTPAADSNVDFTLGVRSVSVDTLSTVIDPQTGNPYTSESTPYDLNILVQPVGDADGANIQPVPLSSQNFNESSIEHVTGENSANDGIALSSLVSVALNDTDGSETLSLRVEGLPTGFTLTGATPLTTDSDGVVTAWSLSPAQLSSVFLHAPTNYSGADSFTLVSITTENDGDSLTESHRIEFAVAPSAEATMNLQSAGNEDTPIQLDFSVQHQNGDTDERIDSVWFSQSEVAAASLTLTYGPNGTSLEDAAANPQNGVVIEGGWYKFSGNALTQIYAQGDANYAGNTSFNIQYTIEDPAGTDNTTDGASLSSDLVTITENQYTVSINPVTDTPTLALSSDYTDTITSSSVIHLTLNVGNDDGNSSSDYDGSEQFIRILLDNVPQGVTVENGSYIGDGSWVLVTDSAMNSELAYPLNLSVSPAAGVDNYTIDVTVQTQDGAQGGTEAEILTASQSFQFSTNFSGGTGEQPAEILELSQLTFDPTEDQFFVLSDAVSAEITNVPNNSTTVTISGLPEGSEVTNMEQTFVNGVSIWTATVTGDNDALQTMLDNIQITPPENFNRTDGAFEYDIQLTTFMPNGTRNQLENPLHVSQLVVPVTDDAEITITTPVLTENDVSSNAIYQGQDIPFTISVANSADDPNWSLVDNKLYLTLDESNIGAGGQLFDNQGQPVALQSVSGVTGISDGNYYVIDVASKNDVVNLAYRANSPYADGSLGINVSVRGQESYDDNGSTVNVAELTSTQSTTVEIRPVNDGYDFSVANAAGVENNPDQGLSSNLIQLNVTDNGLMDSDGSESAITAILSGVPSGFLVYTGSDINNAQITDLANNTGSRGSDTNSWILSTDSQLLPNYIAILPPEHWSGDINSLYITIVSGEDSLNSVISNSQSFTLSVAPVADGLTLDATPSFGAENQVIEFNLNANLNDLSQAAPNGTTNGDSSGESVTLEITGLGQYAAFYINNGTSNVEIDNSGTAQFSYNAGSDTYTVSGLSASDLNNLGFKQASNAIDSNGLSVRAQTVESANGDTSAWTNPVNIAVTSSEQFATTGDDQLLWNGGAIDALAGNDTIQLRYGESVSGSTLASQLDNVESIDLTGMGSNTITALNAQDVLNITDSNNTLTIDGDSSDHLSLSSFTDSDSNVIDWTHSSDTADHAIYTATINTQTVTLQVENTVTID